jgi:ATP-dependent helicase/DNAse subunit B
MKYTKQKQDKYNAVWLSHSSVSDYLKCPRLYYLRNVWKNSNGRKVNIVSPHMSLGSAVHACIEPLAKIKTDERKEKIKWENLEKTFLNIWEKYKGEKGGFENVEQEEEFKGRGEKMLKLVSENPGPILNKTIKYYDGDFIPNIYLSEEENIILCGFVDWIEYLENTDTLKVIDFKTGKNDENEDSFQLPIYKILVETLQKRKVTEAAYWYLDRDAKPKNVELFDEDTNEVKEKILNVGIEIKNKKEDKNFPESFECKYKKEFGESCKYCRDFEAIFEHDKSQKKNDDFEFEVNLFDVEKNENIKKEIYKVRYLGVGDFKQDLYFVKK